jgi:hypothetical protein
VTPPALQCSGPATAPVGHRRVRSTRDCRRRGATSEGSSTKVHETRDILVGGTPARPERARTRRASQTPADPRRLSLTFLTLGDTGQAVRYGWTWHPRS